MTFAQPDDPRFARTEYVIDGSHEDSFNIWHRWSFLYGLEMEQETAGYLTTIGHVGKRPITICVFWFVVAGYLVAFVEGTSQLVDYKMIEDWQRAVFPCLRNYRDRHSNATNFHNISNDIERRRERDGKATPIRDFDAVQRAIQTIPLTPVTAAPRRMSWRDADQIAEWVAGDGTDATRLALADGIREGRR